MLRTIFKSHLTAIVLTVSGIAADLPIHQVLLYKNGVAYIQCSGEIKAGDSAKLEFKATEMNDVLKSLTITDRNGGSIGSIRYDASESLEKRLAEFPFAVAGESTLAAFLDQLKGERLELIVGTQTVTGTIVSARVARTADHDKALERELVMLLTDSGEIRSFDLEAATALKFVDLKLQLQLKAYLTALSSARSKDRRSVYIDANRNGPRDFIVGYVIPAPVWKSSYRLFFPSQGRPSLEGWAIVNNTGSDDWTNVRLSVISGRPSSFVTQLYEPFWLSRPSVELAEDRPVAPVVFSGSLGSIAEKDRVATPFAARAPAFPGVAGARSETNAQDAQLSSVSVRGDAREAGELFEYSFAEPVTVKKGESAMLPFLQLKVNARKLLVYAERFGLHPMNAAEITNSTGETLDGGPITVYDGNTYAGEAMVETIKQGDKRLISYGVDLGTRVTTAFDTSRQATREIHFRRGLLTTRSAIEEVKTYSINNVDSKEKIMIVEHPHRPGYKLLNQQPGEKTENAYRFEVKVGPKSVESLAVREERLTDETISISSATPDALLTLIQNKALSATGRAQLEQIAQKKTEITSREAALKQGESDLSELVQDQARIRSNIQSLNNVSGQQDLVQQYARQLAAVESRLASARASQTDLRHKKSVAESELGALIEKTDF